MQPIIALALYLDFLIQRTIEYDWEYAIISREFIAALLSTAIVRHSWNRLNCLITAWLWLDFFDLLLCDGFTETQYFGVMGAVCVYLSVNKYLNGQ